ncbi:MAG: YbaB/EbfC family nucleoid-associated protein [bacterium]|nr:YbaB/EbfC family nucleoid-associated protein [bacterium]MDY2830389.1 YbaB/EbfC family nucleoid-associated protein [Alphaproteobacteria bacterium]
MMNIQGLMKQAQIMQKKMQEEQARLAEEEAEGTSGGGMVKIILNGKFSMTHISIDKSIVDPEETEVLEDLIKAAYNDAKEKIDAKMNDSMSSLTGGLNLGGLKLPF